MNFMLLSLFGLGLIFAIIWKFCIRAGAKKKTVCILVLGDIGRSPRMQYHALSFAREGYYVDLVGYSGSEPLRELREHRSVKIHYLPEISGFQELPRFLVYVVKTLWLSSLLMVKLVRDIRSSYLLVQNPPSVPTIPLCWLYSRIFGACFIIDWHNYGYTIMSLTLGPAHVLVRLTKFIESFFGSRADKHFCVTAAMKSDLREKWNIEAKVLYDRPPAEFKPIALTEKHSLLMRLAKTYEALSDTDESSKFTERLENGVIRLKENRPGFIVSSTSWTDDEDFSILFNALHEYEISCDMEGSKLPDIVCAVTGKGPLKDFWTAIIQRKKWRHVKVITPWLENEDYPKLLASADLGICLHTSTSGLDLPMKVVDMFGCGLPVCAYNYKCLNELVKHNENSYVFSNDKELAARLKDWFVNFPTNDEQRSIEEKFKLELTKFREIRWHVEVSTIINDRPIIGILSQELTYTMRPIYSDKYDSYIAASYVKFIESAGARVVPIWIGKNEEYYKNIMMKINGILLPGGSSAFNNTNGYAEAGKVIYTIAKRLNTNGDHFPVWGTCLGFELLTYLAANETEHRTDCSSNKQTLPLEFTKGFRSSRMFRNAPQDVIDILRDENVTANFHRYCVTEKDLKRVSLDAEFRVMSLNNDINGIRFISSLEHVDLPFYGVQFHPEKNMFEWVRGKAIPHSYEAIKIARYFADFFINEARQNNHRFSSTNEERENLIYRYPATYTAQKGSDFEQCYLFKNAN